MENNSGIIKNLIMFKRDQEIEESLKSGWDPNFEGGWPVRLAARYGCSSIVETFIKYGANPHLLSESGKSPNARTATSGSIDTNNTQCGRHVSTSRGNTNKNIIAYKMLLTLRCEGILHLWLIASCSRYAGASTLQLAVYSGEHWETNGWSFLLSCCDSSQLADGAAVAIIFNNSSAFQRILETGRCNTRIPTTLTGKTLEQLAKGYKMTHLLNLSIVQSPNMSSHSPQTARIHRSEVRNTLTPQQSQRNLSPSVARFFQQTVGQPTLLSPRTSALDASSPTTLIN